VKIIQFKYNCRTILVETKNLFLLLISILCIISYFYSVSILKMISNLYSYFTEQKYIIPIPISIFVNGHNPVCYTSKMTDSQCMACRCFHGDVTWHGVEQNTQQMLKNWQLDSLVYHKNVDSKTTVILRQFKHCEHCLYEFACFLLIFLIV